MKNVLIQYKDGGYEGCFWEWNFFAYDVNGEFHNVLSTGRNGIDNAKDAQTYLSDPQYNRNNCREDYFIYKLGTKKGLKELATETNSVLVAGLVKWFNKFSDAEYNGKRPYALCNTCKREISDPDEIHLEEWHGCGGMMITADIILCNDCHICCDNCGEYCGDKPQKVDDMCLCEYCKDERK